MFTSQLTFPLPGNGSAVLTLSLPLAPQTLQQIERSLSATFDALHAEAPGTDTDAGQIEYASWQAHLGWLRH